MADQIELPPPPPPVPPVRRARLYVAIWNNGKPVKANIDTKGFPRWKSIEIEEYVSIAVKFRAQLLIAEQASIDREFGHMAMGL